MVWTIQILQEFSFNENSSTQLQSLYRLNTQPPELECHKLLEFLVSILCHHCLHHKLPGSIDSWPNTNQVCPLHICHYLAYTYGLIGFWNWRKCLGHLHHWHCEIQVPERRTSFSSKKLVERTITFGCPREARYISTSQENSLKIRLKFKQFTPRHFHSTALFRSSLSDIALHQTRQNHSYTHHQLTFAIPYHCPAYCYKLPLWCHIITSSELHHFFYVLWLCGNFHTWTSPLSHASYMSSKQRHISPGTLPNFGI